MTEPDDEGIEHDEKYKITYIADNGGTIRGELSQYINNGESGEKVIAIANEGYEFVRWADGITTPERYEENVTENKNITAFFTKKSYTVTYIANEGGKIEGKSEQKVLFGEKSVSVRAVADMGYEFIGWLDGYDKATRTDECVKSDIEVTALFKVATYTIQYNIVGNGYVEGEVNQTVEHGKHATSVTAVANEGYKFIGWSDGSGNANRWDVNVTSNKSVTAEFVKVFQVRYETDNGRLGMVKDNSISYTELFQSYDIEVGKDAPIVTAVPKFNEIGEQFVFLYWSDGVTTAERHDTCITEPLTLTAYFGCTVKYSVNENTGGRIEGDTFQNLLLGESTTTVTAIPDDGYVFCGWSDFEIDCKRSNDFIKEDWSQDCAVMELIAYFEPVTKKFIYDYGIAGGISEKKEIILNRNKIHDVEFDVPVYEGYDFYGWYADKDYRIKIANETGRYLYGYAAFSLKTDMLYARWYKHGEIPDNHKVLLVFVDEVHTNLYSYKINQDVEVYKKLTALEYEMSKWITETFCNLLNEWFEGEVTFEVDAYYTTQVVTEGIDGGKPYRLYADDILEVATLAYLYHSTITAVGFGKVAGNINLEDDLLSMYNTRGLSVAKHACVYIHDFFPSGYNRNPEFLAACKRGEENLDGRTDIHSYIHEFIHTGEITFTDYKTEFLHPAEAYANETFGRTTIENTLKPILLGEFVMDGKKIGFPKEYWRHEMVVEAGYGAGVMYGLKGGQINVVGESQDLREPYESCIVRKIKYGSDFSVIAVPYEGYRFVRWTDGITTATRHDKNIISYLSVYAIFDKI